MISVHAAPWQATTHGSPRCHATDCNLCSQGRGCWESAAAALGSAASRTTGTTARCHRRRTTVRRAIHPRAMLLGAAAPTARKTLRAPPVVPFALASLRSLRPSPSQFLHLCAAALLRRAYAVLVQKLRRLVKALKRNRNPKGNSNRPARALHSMARPRMTLGTPLNLRFEPAQGSTPRAKPTPTPTPPRSSCE